MKNHIVLFFFILFSTLTAETNCGKKQEVSNNLKFVIVVPSFNNAKFYEQNLTSIFSQTYPHFRVIYIDDASHDQTGTLVKTWVEKNHYHEKMTLITNVENKGGLANIYLACHLCQPDEIVCLVDGDDCLAHSDVLNTLAAYYSNPSVWMTYGQFKHDPSGNIGLCASFELDDLIHQKTRALPWRTSHLKTFYAGLFHQIQEEDLKFSGSFISSATDLAIMYPLLDMATTHAIFIPEVLYLYNNQNPISHHRIRHLKQRFFRDIIKARSTYPALTTPPYGRS